MHRLTKRFMFTLIILSMSLMPTLAQTDEALGRDVTQDDWLTYMPILIGSIILVLIIDAVFIIPIFRKSDNAKKDEA